MLLNCDTPIPGSYSCDSLAYQAKEASLLVNGTDLVSGRVSCSELGVSQVFLLRATATDWTTQASRLEGQVRCFQQ
jgi:hypothetical protein